MKPATVNRELDTLRSVLSKAVEWGKLDRIPGRAGEAAEGRQPADPHPDARTNSAGCCGAPRKMRALVTLALITGARIGELLGAALGARQDG